MQRLSASIRSAILSDAAAAPATITRWSVNTLANINSPSPANKLPRSDVAEKLLNDIKLRLASQLVRTIDMKEQAEAIFTLSEENQLTQTHKQRRTGGPLIIRAVNQQVRLSPKVQIEYEKRSQLEKKSALKNLADLESLHANTYILAFELLENNAPTLCRYTKSDATLVASVFESIRSRHASSVECLADVVIALRRARTLHAGLGGVIAAGQFCGINLQLIDDFLRERLGVQFLCDHYVALHKGKPNGGIAVGCDLMDVVEGAVTEARHVCDANLGVFPEVFTSFGLENQALIPNTFEKIVDATNCNLCTSINITLIRPWLHHALVEVLKNSMQSSVQRAIDDGGDGSLPSDVHIRLVEGNNAVYIIMADQGAGLSEEDTRRAFKFADSSSRKRWDRIEEQTSYGMVRQPLGSLGVGLPLSRMMCQMFGGDLFLSNREAGGGLDSGCTVIIKLIKDDTHIENSDIHGIVSDFNQC